MGAKRGTKLSRAQKQLLTSNGFTVDEVSNIRMLFHNYNKKQYELFSKPNRSEVWELFNREKNTIHVIEWNIVENKWKMVNRTDRISDDDGEGNTDEG